MADRIVPWIVWGGVTLVLLVIGLVDTTETTPPEVGNETPPEEAPPPEVGPVQSAIGQNPTFLLGFALAILFAAGLAAAFVWGDVLPAERRTLIILSVIALLSVVLAFNDLMTVVDPGNERRDPYVLPLAQTLVFFGMCVFFIVWTHMDGFSQGSLVTLGIIELFVLWGWLGTPGGRSYVYHTNVTVGMLLLAASVLLFHQFQEKRRSKTTA